MTYHLEKLSIHAFRQLRDVTFHDLGRVNLLVGVNNSGKTSVLEAIAAHCRPLDPLKWIAIARQREVRSSREPDLDSLRWLFPQHQAESDDPYYQGEIRISGYGSYANLETSAVYHGMIAPTEDPDQETAQDVDNEDDEESSESAYSPPTPEFSQRGAKVTLQARVPRCRWMEFEADSDGICGEQFRLWEGERYVSKSAPSNLSLPVATVAPFSHRVRQLQISKLTDATLKGQKFSVVEMVRLIDPDIEDLEILSRSGLRPTLYVRHKRTGFTPLSALGDGIRRAIAMALSLNAAQQGVLLVDEIETAIHKDALTTVFQWLVRACRHLNVQLFATTHSLEAIDALLTAQIDDPAQIVAYHLPAQGEGAVKRFEGEILENLRFDRGLDIR